MKRLLLAASIASIMSTSAFADSSPVAPVKVTLSTQDILTLSAALRSLDGHNVILKDGDKTSVTTVPYNFKAGFLWALAVDWDQINPILKEYQDVLKKQISASGAAKEDFDQFGNLRATSPVGQKVDAAMAPILEATHDLSVIKLNRDEFNLGDGGDQNKIPPSVLSALRPIIVQPGDK